MKREYLTQFGAAKVYPGRKSVNVSLTKDQALRLAIGIIWACRSYARVDLTFLTEKRQKHAGGKIPKGQILSRVSGAS